MCRNYTIAVLLLEGAPQAHHRERPTRGQGAGKASSGQGAGKASPAKARARHRRPRRGQGIAGQGAGSACVAMLLGSTANRDELNGIAEISRISPMLGLGSARRAEAAPVKQRW